jgi:DNA-binding MarR family transcriptional regulator
MNNNDLKATSSEEREALIQSIKKERRHNLRQVLWRAHRTLNRKILKRLKERGYTDIKPIHILLFSTIDLEGTRITELADRAGITVQGMGQIVNSLEELGYVQRTVDETDNRVRIVTLTDTGWELILVSFENLQQIEDDCEDAIGSREFKSMKKGLDKIAEALADK